MICTNRKDLYNEKVINNSHELIEEKNKNKLTLRKKKLNKEIQNKRMENLNRLQLNSKININPELKFKINKFEDSFKQVFSYLNSNNGDLISYALNELRIYLTFNDINIKSQNLIVENKFLYILLNLGHKFIELKNKNDLKQILWILINIQVFNEGSKDYLQILYTNEYFKFYYDCLIFEGDYFLYDILNMIENLIINDYNINLKLLRSDVFSSILDWLQNQTIIDSDIIEISLKIIAFAVDLSDQESLLNEADIKIIDNCFNLLVKYVFGSNSENELSWIYRGLFNISSLDDEYKFNKRIIYEGVTTKILKLKFKNLKINKDVINIVDYALRIIANNLTCTDTNCEIIYNLNIIDYYNNILEIFDDNYNIVRDILSGLANISAGSKRTEILRSSIWEEKYIRQYCNKSEEFIIEYIKITKFLIYNADNEILKFIYNSKIIHYLIDLFNTNNLSELICRKIIELIDNYLKKFNTNQKESEEYIIIYQKFKDLSNFSNKFNNLEI